MSKSESANGMDEAWEAQLHKGRSFGAPLLWLLALTLLVVQLSGFAEKTSARLPAFANPANPVRSFQRYYCAFVAVTLIWNHLEGHRKFYRWFVSSKIKPSHVRGLGHAGVKFYGFIPSPFLTTLQHDLACGILALSLLGSCGPWAPRCCLSVAFVSWFFYYSQLFCATKAGGHGSTLIPGALLMLALSPTVDDAYGQFSRGDAWALDFVKLQVAATYCGSGLCKLAGSLHFRQFWGNGTTLQAYTFDAMWSRPGGEFTWMLQAAAVQCPRLLVVAGTLSLFFEICFPFALTSRLAGILFSFAALAFHTGVYFLQGFDFLSQWCPVILLFVVPGPASSQTMWDSLHLGARGTASLDVAYFGVGLGFLYTMASLFVSLTMMDVWYGELPPFSCCPMFLVPRNLFAEGMPRWWCMTGVPQQREAGFMDPLIYSPANAKHYLPEEDLMRFPYKVLQFGSLSQVPKDLQSFVRPEYLGHESPILCFSNFQVPSDLHQALTRMVQLSFEYTASDAWNPLALREIIKQQRLCRYYFEKAEFKGKSS